MELICPLGPNTQTRLAFSDLWEGESMTICEIGRKSKTSDDPRSLLHITDRILLRSEGLDSLSVPFNPWWKAMEMSKTESDTNI